VREEQKVKAMRRAKVLGFMLAVFLCIGLATGLQAADFSGTWKGIYKAAEQTGFSEIEVTVTQNGNSLTGHISGVSGDLTGTVAGNVATVTAQFDGACTGTFTGILNSDGIVSVSNVSSGCTAMLSRNLTDRRCWINLHRHLWRPSGAINGNVWAHCTFEDATAARLVTPLGKEMTMAWDEEAADWLLNIGMLTETQATNLPDGIYYYVVNFGNGTTGTNFSGIAGSFPSEFPKITQPAAGATVDETHALTIAWSKWLSAGSSVSPFIWINAGNQSYSVSAASAQTSVPAYSYDDAAAGDFGVSFGDGSGYSSTKNTVTFSHVWTGSGHYVSPPSVMLGRGTIAGSSEEYFFMSYFEGYQVRSASLVTPKNESIPFVQHDYDGDFWNLSITDQTAPAVFTRFPNGNYQINIEFLDDSTDTRTINLSGSFPAAPVITAPADGDVVDPAADLTISWQRWLTEASDAAMIRVMLQQGSGGPLEAFEIWGENIAADKTSVTIPSNYLFSGQSYKLVVLFLQTNGKTSANIVNFQTPQNACSNPAVKVNSSYYDTIQSACDSAADGNTIRIRSALFNEDIALNRNIRTTLKGGHNCEYNANPGYSAIEGSVAISKGTVTIENLIIK
jgi:hypothetical protein